MNLQFHILVLASWSVVMNSLVKQTTTEICDCDMRRSVAVGRLTASPAVRRPF